PTPQAAAIAVVTSTLLVAGIVIASDASMSANFPAVVFGATALIAMVGLADDVKTVPVLPRLILQGLSVGAVLVAASGELRILPACPLWIERAGLFLAGLWFVNLVKFMDGIDWMTVA